MWGYVAVSSFGGPAGQIAMMHRVVVDERRWLTEDRFLHALNFCMLLPGPEAQQLATYVGWLMHGRRGALIAGGLFVLPGALAMLALSYFYVAFGQVPFVADALGGVRAAVVAIVVMAVVRLSKRALRTRMLKVWAVVTFILIAMALVPFPVMIFGSGVLGWLLGKQRPGWFATPGSQSSSGTESPPHLLDEDVPPLQARRALKAAAVALVLWLGPLVLLAVVAGSSSIFTQQASLFSRTAVLTFGGAYAVLGYVAQQAVYSYGWLSPADFVVGLGFAEITPGPLILVLEFVAFVAAYTHPGSLPPLLAGIIGATIAIWMTFVPCFFFIFLGAPFVERLRGNRAFANALAMITAAVVGVVANLGFWYSAATFFDVVTPTSYGPITVGIPTWSTINPGSIAIALLTAFVLIRLKWGPLRALACGAAAGILLGALHMM